MTKLSRTNPTETISSLVGMSRKPPCPLMSSLHDPVAGGPLAYGIKGLPMVDHLILFGKFSAFPAVVPSQVLKVIMRPRKGSIERKFVKYIGVGVLFTPICAQGENVAGRV